MFKKFYDRIRDFTFLDIVFINFMFFIVSLLAWLIFLVQTDLELNDDIAILGEDILWCIGIHLFSWAFSSTLASGILYILKRRKATPDETNEKSLKKIEKDLENEKD